MPDVYTMMRSPIAWNMVRDENIDMEDIDTPTCIGSYCGHLPDVEISDIDRRNMVLRELSKKCGVNRIKY